MALALNLGGGVHATASGAGSSATEQAFGSGYSPAGTPSSTAALSPNDPFGVAFWSGILCLGLLLLIRHSLPA